MRFTSSADIFLNGLLYVIIITEMQNLSIQCELSDDPTPTIKMNLIKQQLSQTHCLNQAI